MKFRSLLILSVLLITMVISVPVQAHEVHNTVNESDSQAVDTYSISGTVIQIDGQPLNGVTVTLVEEKLLVYLPIIVRNASSGMDPTPSYVGDVQNNILLDTFLPQTTGPNGTFQFTGVPEGRYRLTPSLDGASFDPISRVVYVGPNATNQNFIQNDLVEVSTYEQFEMGCDIDNEIGDSCWSDESPLHTITLSAFMIDKMEVTNAKYKQCVDAGICDPPDYSNSKSRSTYYGDSDYDQYPVIFVSWYDANKYCKWAGKRLPTEAEWEMAARGNTVRIYPWDPPTEPTCSLANHYYFNGVSYSYCVNPSDTNEVGQYQPGASPYGALDMAGNVKEWVNDWYADNYYSISALVNPTGPTTGNLEFKVARGGSFDLTSEYIRTAKRYFLEPESSFDNTGFRCVLP